MAKPGLLKNLLLFPFFLSIFLLSPSFLFSFVFASSTSFPNFLGFPSLLSRSSKCTHCLRNLLEIFPSFFSSSRSAIQLSNRKEDACKSRREERERDSERRKRKKEKKDALLRRQWLEVHVDHTQLDTRLNRWTDFLDVAQIFLFPSLSCFVCPSRSAIYGTRGGSGVFEGFGHCQASACTPESTRGRRGALVLLLLFLLSSDVMGRQLQASFPT